MLLFLLWFLSVLRSQNMLLEYDFCSQKIMRSMHGNIPLDNTNNTLESVFKCSLKKSAISLCRALTEH